MAVKYNTLSIIMYPNDIYRNWHHDYQYIGKYKFLRNIIPDSYDLDVSRFTVSDASEWEIYDLTQLSRPPVWVIQAVRKDISDKLDNLCVLHPQLRYFVMCHYKDEAYNPREGTKVTKVTHFHVVLVELDTNFKPESLADWWEYLQVLGMDRYKFVNNVPVVSPLGELIHLDSPGYVPDLDALEHRVQKVLYTANMVRYLTHGGRIDKALYPMSDIVTNDLGMLHQFYYPEMSALAYADMVELVLFKGYTLLEVFNWAKRNNCLQVFDTHQRKLIDLLKHANDSISTYDSVGHDTQETMDMVDNIKQFEENEYLDL